jgi:hypothetical protein
MSWWEAVAAIAQVAGTVMSSQAADRNGDRAKTYGAITSTNILKYGSNQALMNLMTAGFNSRLIRSQAALKADTQMKIAAYNSSLLSQTANYNSLLYNEEIDSIYEAAELDSKVLEVNTEKAIGTLEAQQSASGTVVGQDSNADVVTSIMAESALEDLVIKTNAKTKAKSLLNAAAQGEWQAMAEGKKLMYEAQVSGQAEMFAASNQSLGTLLEGKLNAWSVLEGAKNRAFESVFSANQTASNAYDQSTAYMVTGLGNAANSYAKSESKVYAKTQDSNPSLLDDNA